MRLLGCGQAKGRTAVTWLNANTGLVQAIATVVLVLVTAYYAYLTRALARESRLSTIARFEPLLTPVSVTYRTTARKGSADEIESATYTARVANSGRGTAYSIRASLAAGAHKLEGRFPMAPFRLPRDLPGVIQEEDPRPPSPSQNAVPADSYQDVHFTLKYDPPVRICTDLRTPIEQHVKLRVEHRGALGKEAILEATFAWDDDRFVLEGAPRTRGSAFLEGRRRLLIRRVRREESTALESKEAELR